MPKFTDAQLSAITEQSKTLLVSAAAGSGKTFTLVQRVLGSVTRDENPIPLDRLLVVTFTKDTAEEVKKEFPQQFPTLLPKTVRTNFLQDRFHFCQVLSFLLSTVFISHL